ncbi:MAG: phage holin family protein [Rhodopseudomonas sp.]|uniref:phage holin family protein n=1 Tax=unclassified Rhodopseudomonas TaxID=2638247 RepID=UPI0013DF1E9C|nr:phage holin family protein [Rhodopseudomonas sp. BR0M22]MCD0420220.1 phage holin family protein [Rubrivivax sp. JA1024]NEW90986.1 phage holin family protein [Rhodopseudomonas sp. BR0M22]
MTPPNNRSIPDLVGDAFTQFAKLVSNEFELARAEISDKFGQIGRAVALIGAGAVILIPGLVVLLMAGAAALVEHGFSSSIAYLIVGGCTTGLAALLIGFGANRLSPEALKPEMTIEQLQRDKEAAGEMIR